MSEQWGRVERSEVREVGIQGLVGHDKDLGCHFICDNKSLDVLKQEVT